MPRSMVVMTLHVNAFWMRVIFSSTYGRLNVLRSYAHEGSTAGPECMQPWSTLWTRSFLGLKCFVPFSAPQLFVIVVWNFELYMIPLALLLPLAWNYILITSGKDTRQDVVSRPIVWFKYTTDRQRFVHPRVPAVLFFHWFKNDTNKPCINMLVLRKYMISSLLVYRYVSNDHNTKKIWMSKPNNLAFRF